MKLTRLEWNDADGRFRSVSIGAGVGNIFALVSALIDQGATHIAIDSEEDDWTRQPAPEVVA